MDNTNQNNLSGDEQTPLVHGRTTVHVPSDSADPIEASNALVEASKRQKKAVSAFLAVLCVAAVAVVVVLLTQDSMPTTNNGDSSSTKTEASALLSSMDRSINPCNDFYQYACGQWLAQNEIPDDQVAWGRSFSVIHKRILEQLRDYLDEGETYVSTFYNSCMNEKAIEETGLEEMQKIFTLIDTKLDTHVPPLTIVASLAREGVDTLFSFGVQVDVKSPEKYTLVCSQGGLGLPDKDYYLDDAHQTLREKYKQHISKMLSLAGASPQDALVQANYTLNFETVLAQGSLRREDLRDPIKLYNPKTSEELDSTYAPLKWTEFWSTLLAPDAEFDKTTQLIVEVPEFLNTLKNALATVSNDALRAYFRFHALNAYSNELPEAFRNETFDFYRATLGGQKEQQPRWKKCVALTDGNLPDALGKIYTDAQFPEAHKIVATQLIGNIENAFHEILDSVNWMDNVTRANAVSKLSKIDNHVGYPDVRVDYSSITKMIGSSVFSNVRVIRQFYLSRDIKKLDKPVDDEWDMSAPTVNAYYDPSKNLMVFPAGILRPPFFNLDFPAAMNYGAIGAVMGHELTHAFDDEGSKYDGTGRLVDWWEPATQAKFENATKCVELQFDKYPVQGNNSLHLSGKLTLGENIADLGGVKVAYKAFQNYKRIRKPRQATLDFPPPFNHFVKEDQLFFVAFAQAWCEKVRDKYAQDLANTDPHSPPNYRVKGSLTNLPEFAAAFECPAGTNYNPPADQRCSVW